MNFVFATLLWVAGSTLVALSFQQVARANPDERIPMAWGRPRHHPGEAYAYRAIAFLLWGFAVVTWGGASMVFVKPLWGSPQVVDM